MNYAASVFDILYVCFALSLGILILVKGRNTSEKLLGAAAVTLGTGELAQTVTRMMSRFAAGDYGFALAVNRACGGVILACALFLVYKAWHGYYGEGEYHKLSRLLLAMAVLRLLLLLPFVLAPNPLSPLWWALRSLPLLVLAAVVVRNYFRNRWRSARFSLVWLLTALAALLYLPSDLLSGVPSWILSALSRLCLGAMVWLFFCAVTKDEPGARRRKDA